MRWRCAAAVSFLLLLRPGDARAAADEALVCRVVDVGAGLCCVVKIPPADAADRWRYVIYDAGNYQDRGASALAAVRDLVPEGADIDLMVLSHSDSDHLGAVPGICERHRVKKLIHSGYPRGTHTYEAAVAAIETECEQGCDGVDLSKTPIAAGSSWRVGGAAVTFVCGFHEPLPEWGIDPEDEESEYRNAGSVVLRVWYRGRSILLCGDTVGRRIDDPPEACRDAEKWMVENTGFIVLDSDVIVAPHHGADNGSSTRFVKAVSPDWVVFSAGHKYAHPRRATAQRYLDAGVPADHLLRTDRGDDEGDREWNAGRVPGHSDPVGDDDVEVVFRREGEGATVSVGYRTP